MPKIVKPRVLLFDCYNTLLETRTDEHDLEVWEQLATFLKYRNVYTRAQDLHDRYFAQMKIFQKGSNETYPEIHMAGIFQAVLEELGYCGDKHIFDYLTQLFRMLSIRHLAPFPDTIPVLQDLQQTWELGIISDAQRIFVEPELAYTGLIQFFDVRIISGDYGYRKPDKRLFEAALKAFEAEPHEALYIGDNVYRDICGAHAANMPGIWLQRHIYQERTDLHCEPDQAFPSLKKCATWLKTLEG